MMANAMTASELQALLEKMTGQALPLQSAEVLQSVAASISEGKTLGYSQFNELLLNLGYDRVDRAFFDFLCDPEAVRKGGHAKDEISSSSQLENGINAFRQLSLLLYGNVKFGFKTLAPSSEALQPWIEHLSKEDTDTEYRSRHAPLVPLKEIPKDETFLLGYLSEKLLRNKLDRDPNDENARALLNKRPSVIEMGKWNHNVYLTSDHLDVYVATSMRARHEFVFVSEFMKRLRASTHVEGLNLRVFDPTQAYCVDRVDKGLAEALMLKRAQCTIYLAQESDTLGKDSELASTLAQGKPVLAYVPDVDDEFWSFVWDTMLQINREDSEPDLLLQLLRIYAPQSAWDDSQVSKWLFGGEHPEIDSLKQRVRAAMKAHYDDRANTLKEKHPLGLQTNLNTGVANGVLVVRKVEECARVLRQILLNQLKFDVEDKEIDGSRYVFLREQITGCVFRVMTGDKLLTNSFWNFYPTR